MQNARRILAVVLLAAAGCSDSNSSGATSSGGPGYPTPPLWNDTSTVSTGVPGGAGANGDTPLLWTDPNLANIVFGILDPTDTRTYTTPDIYILGLKHPLMTDVIQRDFPVIIAQEDRLTQLLIEWRIQQYEQAIGIQRTRPGFPNAAFITEYGDLRRNARAHAKHYAVWHSATGPLPMTNAEGDALGGRLTKSYIQAAASGQLVASGPTYGIPDRVFTQWITNNRNFILQQNWTHLGVGYWAGTGSSELHYWNVIFAEDPQAIVNTPAIPIVFFP